MNNKLGILSIFHTIDGEQNYFGQGGFSIFIRTRGCSVGCHWCDTKYSWPFKGGEEMTPLEIVGVVNEISADGCTKVTITGGEPLQQDNKALAELIHLLLENWYSVTVETAGTENTVLFRTKYNLPIYENNSRLGFVVDYKLDESQFNGKMDLVNHFHHLSKHDIVKFVISNEKDFRQAVAVVANIYSDPNTLNTTPTPHAFPAMYFSPAMGILSPADLIDWMKNDKTVQYLGIGLNLQLHKYIWTDDFRAEEDDGIDFTKRTLGREEHLRRMSE